MRYSNGLPRRGRDSSLCRLIPRSAKGCNAPSSEPGLVEHGHHQRRLVRWPQPRILGAEDRELREVLLLRLDPLGEHGQPEDLDAASTLAIAASSRDPDSAIMRAAPAVSWTGTGSIRIDARNSSHCASACQWERARRTSSSRAPGTPSSAWSTRTTHLAHDPEQGRVRQQVVGLVDRPGLGVLERHDAERRLAAGDAGEHEPDGVARERVGIGERAAGPPVRCTRPVRPGRRPSWRAERSNGHDERGPSARA